MAIDDERVILVEVTRDTREISEINGPASLVEVINDDIDVADVQTTLHIIEVVRRYVEPIETTGNGISVDIVNASGGTVDSEAIAAIVRLVYVANEIPTGIINGVNVVFNTADSYKPKSTRLFVNGLRQSAPDNYTEDGTTQITLGFVLTSDDVLLVDYIKL